jgi:hypothetical protein
MPNYPISFSIHHSKILNHIPKKTRLMATIIPGDAKTYIYGDNEKAYYEGYQCSLFGLTKCKGGWDCLRHYEIMANGCIPYFLDLDKCPANTMTHLPKKIILEAMKLYDVMKSKPDPLSDTENVKKCHEYIKQLMDYTRTHLTHKKMAENVFSTLKLSYPKNPKKVLFLSSRKLLTPDNLRDFMLNGFKELMGKDCHDFPKVPHLYKHYKGNMYHQAGRGMTYSRLIDESARDDNKDATLIEDIKNHHYDLVIYGNGHPSKFRSRIEMLHIDLVEKHYKKSEILVLCGDDIRPGCCNEIKKKDFQLFTREMV